MFNVRVARVARYYSARREKGNLLRLQNVLDKPSARHYFPLSRPSLPQNLTPRLAASPSAAINMQLLMHLVFAPALGTTRDQKKKKKIPMGGKKKCFFTLAQLFLLI